MTTKAKMIGAAMILGVVGSIAGTTVAFADEIDQVASSAEEALSSADENDATSWFVRFGIRPVARPVARVAAVRFAHARRWHAGYWHGFRYHRGYWR